MEDLNISLTFNPDRIREMYFSNGNGSIFTYKPTQNAFISCVVALIINVLIYLASFSNPGISFLIFIGAIIFLIVLFYSIFVFNKYIKWKKDVEAFVKENQKYKIHLLKLTSSALELTQDRTTTIERWENIKSAKLDDIHIILITSGGPSFIFPASSMTAEEFSKLKEFIANKITTSVPQMLT
jgi:hypothetical protein